MQVFDTPEPILVTVELNVGTVRIVASDRTDTTVDVRPGDRSDFRDLVTAAETRVAYADGELVVALPPPGDLPGAGGAVTVDIEVPAGSAVHGDALAADFCCEGRLGECRISVQCGHLRLAETGLLCVSSLLGNVTVDRVRGNLEAVVECGDVHIRAVGGTARLSRTRGGTHLGEVTGDVSVSTQGGDLRIGRAHTAVEAQAMRGGIRVDEALRGPLVLESASGDIDVGIAGAAAGLDLDSRAGNVYRALDLIADATDSRREPGRAVQVHARTDTGDIVVRRTTHDPGVGTT